MNNYSSFFTHHVTKEENNISTYVCRQNYSFSKKFKTVLENSTSPSLSKNAHFLDESLAMHKGH